MDCDHHGHSSTMCHSGDCSLNLHPSKDCQNDASLGSGYCCVQRMESYTAVCPKRLDCISCQSPTAGHINNLVCSFISSPTLSNSPPMCTPSSTSCPSSSICCNQHTPYPCYCYSNHTCPIQVGSTIEKGVIDGDPPCPVLKRERSPSPPPLSPIPSDMGKKTDEKPPSLLHHRQEEETDTAGKNDTVNGRHLNADESTDTEEELQSRARRSSQAEQNPTGPLLQDVVNRFSEKLETIKPLEKDPPPVSSPVNVSEKEQLQPPSTSQNLQFQADAHLTEIITKVLHRRNGCDYNLTELFKRHDSKEPKSPNTRSRRRQEVLTAIATPADDTSARRHTLQIKREFARLDQSCNRRKGSPAKKTRVNDGKVSVSTSSISSDSNLVKGESKREMEESEEPVENQNVVEPPLNMLPTDSDLNEVKDEIQTDVVTENLHVFKSEVKEREIYEQNLHPGTQIPSPRLQSKGSEQGVKGYSVQKLAEIMTVTATSAKQCKEGGGSDEYQEAPLGQSSDSGNRPGEGKGCNSPVRERKKSNHSNEVRRTRRNIIPPQRFSSYVTEPRKMFFVACFSESIFNQKIEKDDVLTTKTLDDLFKDPDANDTQLGFGNDTPLSLSEHTGKLAFESTHKEQHGPFYTESENIAAKEKSPTKCSLDIRTDDDDCAAKHTRLRSSPKRLQVFKSASTSPKKSSNRNVDNPPSSSVEYTSPIKLMFVSAVQGKEGVRYSLKSASTGASSQADKSFDPCVVSSWSGTPEKQKRKSPECHSSKVKSISSPRKSATSPVKSSCSPTKSTPSPVKSASSTPKSASPQSKSTSSPSKSASSPRKSASSPNPVSASPKLDSRRSSESTPTKRVAGTESHRSPPKSASSSSKSASSAKSVSSSPKIGSRRSAESTPTKRVAGTESQRSPCDLLSFHESTPQKRRPGRPKKLGPQLEQKVKRPIGRPRKQQAVDSAIGTQTESGSVVANDAEDNGNKNLKITVLYGRSRRNKRMVSEGFDQLQTEFHDACQAVGLKSDLGILMHSSKTSSGNVETASTKLPEEFSFVSPLKESAPLSSRNIKCQKRDESGPSRKPGRPAKVKISGISVTVTTVSPRQRKIQMNRDTRESPEALINKQVLLPELKPAKEPRTISYQSTRCSQAEKGIEAKNRGKDRLPTQTVAVRHSVRVRKPSVHFLHAVATSSSRSYSHSNALLRRSKQLLLNKASNERKKEEQQSSVETSGGKRQLFGQDSGKNISQDLSSVAGVSVDSIFTPKETLKWWTASAEENTMNEELASRIQVISDTWISDTVENKEKEISLNSKSGTKGNSSFTRNSKHSSVVRTLFDCSPNAPRSCSMKQLCSWFMQTTETQSLTIVKKESSRNPYEFRQVPRSANNTRVCPSPQAERLRKHIKKFAKTVPKSPLQHQQAQRRLRRRNNAVLSTHNIRRQLFTPGLAKGRFNPGVQWWRNRAFRNYRATVLNARTKFFTRKERERWQKRPNKKTLKVVTSCSNGHAVGGLHPKCKALHNPAKDHLSDCLGNSSVDQTEEPVDAPKEQNLCSKAWSPETLKECRVFLRKINSPDSESLEEEWDSCTVTLDDGSPSAYVFAGRESKLVGVVKAVKTDRVGMKRRTASREPAGSAPKSVQEQEEMPERRQKGKHKGPGAEPPQPPPAKMLRQSRMRGLTGPRWRDFVFEN